MAKVSLETFGALLAQYRGEQGLGVRAAAKEAGVTPSTFSRVENGYLPDLLNFRKLCAWIKVDPSEVLGSKSISPATRGTIVHPTVASGAEQPPLRAHFRKESTVTLQTAKALADLMLAADRAMALQENL